MPCGHDPDIDTMLAEICEPDLPKITGWAGSKPFATPTPAPEPTCEQVNPDPDPNPDPNPNPYPYPDP